jgi:ABC-2 type transport system permease protein
MSAARTLRIVPTILRVSFAEAVAYRAEFLVWILSTNMPLVMLALWAAVAREAPVGRFGERDFVAYYLATLIVRLLTGCWVIWALNMEIRQGTMALRLLRPIHPLVSLAAENIAALPLRGLVAVPIAAGMLLAAGASHVTHDPVLLALFPLTVLGAWTITFLSMAFVGILAFFLESAASLFGVWFGFYSVLSGYLIPLELFPRWVSGLARVLPFRYALGYPVELLLGMEGRGQALRELAIQWGYVAALLAGVMALWRAGVRRYSAFGG